MVNVLLANERCALCPQGRQTAKLNAPRIKIGPPGRVARIIGAQTKRLVAKMPNAGVFALASSYATQIIL
ncbi:hypothetical protein DWB84_15620 [Saccharophagus sp. K07]|nr:hypothetical protein [Saccharophagus sp. K07]